MHHLIGCVGESDHSPLAQHRKATRWPDGSHPMSTCSQSARDDSPTAIAALVALVRPGECVYVLQVPEIVIPPGFVRNKKRQRRSNGRRAERAIPGCGADMLTLGDADAPRC